MYRIVPLAETIAAADVARKAKDEFLGTMKTPSGPITTFVTLGAVMSFCIGTIATTVADAKK